MKSENYDISMHQIKPHLAISNLWEIEKRWSDGEFIEEETIWYMHACGMEEDLL
jgi:hypothetical protein